MEFSLAPRVSLQEEGDCYYLRSDVPIRRLALNRSLFSVLRRINSKQTLDIITEQTLLKRERLLPVLLDLASRGYLVLEHVPALLAWPLVSIVVPVRDQAAHLLECVQSLRHLDYPADRFEIIVVDDGSRQPVSALLEGCDVSILRRSDPGGPAAARNLGAQASRGELLAFLDADCVADTGWLKELVPFFTAEKLGAVGGLVAGFHTRTFLDRYEEVFSSLNLGKRLISSSEKHSNFYVPTCNLLVSREAFDFRHCEARVSPPKQSADAVSHKETTSALGITQYSVIPAKAGIQKGWAGADYDGVPARPDNRSDSATGECPRGFDPALRVGEDVDFCWRMRDAGFSLLYVPFGKVAHKHPNRLWRMLRRRFDYGTSEAVLYARHPEKKKRFALPAFAALAFLSVVAAIVLLQPYALLATPLFFALDFLWRWSRLRQTKIRVGPGGQFLAAVRNQLGFFYFASFHIVRYYLILLLLGGIFYGPVWLLAAVLLLISSVTDYLVKKPRLIYPVFLFFYTLEHVFYQAGVLWGCVKKRSFRAYLISGRR